VPSKLQLEFLRGVRLFAACSDLELAQVDRLVSLVTAESGQVLTREDTYEPQAFVIVDGEARVSRSERTIAALSAGDFFGEMALLDRRPRVATVTALTPMRLLVCDPVSFTTLLEVGGVARTVLVGLVERLRLADETLVG
jgi:CRP-like cAMP-binding protein